MQLSLILRAHPRQNNGSRRRQKMTHETRTSDDDGSLSSHRAASLNRCPHLSLAKLERAVCTCALMESFTLRERKRTRTRAHARRNRTRGMDEIGAARAHVCIQGQWEICKMARSRGVCVCVQAARFRLVVV